MSEYPRKIKENYGVSTVELVELPMTDDKFTSLNVDEQEVLLPVLNLKKENPNCYAYAFIERLKEKPITMIDILYSYGKIPFDDNSFREVFLSTFSRKYMIESSIRTPGVIYIPQDSFEIKKLSDALKLSVKENVGEKVLMSGYEDNKKIKIKKYAKNVKPDGIMMEFAKQFYEIITGEKVKRPSDPIEKEVNYSIIKEAIFMKNGAMIIDGVQSSKYLAAFQTKSTPEKKDKDKKAETIKDIISVIITNSDDKELYNNPEYLENFSKIVLSSNILEALSAVTQRKGPTISYCGEIDMEKEKMIDNPKIARTIKRINYSLFQEKEQGSSDGR